MTRRFLLALLGLAVMAGTLSAQAQARRPVRSSDFYRLRSVSDPQVSPEGDWVAYVVSVMDSARDKSNADIYMVKWDGSRTVRLTSSPDGESRPRWSPDGRYLAFTSGRGDDTTGAQVWLLDRSGGEAVKLTSLKSGVDDYAWSPDGRRLVVVSQDPEPDSAKAGEEPRPKPIVIDRYHFKQDVKGYLGPRKNHLYLVDVPSGKAEQITQGPWDEESPAWSPDGTHIAFESNRTPDPDRNVNADIWVMEARAGAVPRQLTTASGPERRPVWSPDGRSIAFSYTVNTKFYGYNLERLGIVPAEGGTPRELGAALDRSIDAPVWTPDGAALLAGADDDRSGLLIRIDARTGAVDRLVEGTRAVRSWHAGPSGHVAVLLTDPLHPAEVFALEGRTVRQLTRENDAWLAEVALGTTEGISGRAGDGAVVNGIMVKPAGYAGRRAPTLLRIHGGPIAQDEYAFDLYREVLAAAGYVVITANYRGSSGRGEAYQQAIYADWGNKEVIDVLAVVDEAVRLGVADPDRLGIGGWSYGAMTTNWTIASDTRFKAAMSGAGIGNEAALYGVDQYIYQYDTELGPPWKNPELWEKISYPFFHADRITTPTLFMVGEKDFNVPAAGTEQMYQALKSLGIETQLIIYPGQFHGFTRPSFLVDRLDRWVAWYDKYLKAGGLTP
jgi:dipeptidyl aminopeptidase/acylaminoacyl peptidase